MIAGLALILLGLSTLMIAADRSNECPACHCLMETWSVGKSKCVNPECRGINQERVK